MRKIDNPEDTDERVIHWAKIFKAKTLKGLEELAGEQEVFKNMVLELRKLSEDEKIKQQMEARADYESRMATARGAGYREGLEDGVVKGIEKGKILQLVALVNDGLLAIETGANKAGMSVDEFKRVMKDMV